MFKTGNTLNRRAGGSRSDVAHQRLVRAAVIVIQDLRNMAGAATPQQLDTIKAVLELLTNGLKGQNIRDEQVTITVRGGVAKCTNKTDFVAVTIIDLDNAE